MRALVHIRSGILALALILLGNLVCYGQIPQKNPKKEVPQAVLKQLEKRMQALNLSPEDIAELEISSTSETKHKGIKHLYVQQLHDGIEIHGAISTVNLKDGELISLANRFQKGVDKKIKASAPQLTAEEAVTAAARHLGITLSGSLNKSMKSEGKNQKTLFSKGGISLEPIPAKLVYQPMEDGSLRLAWEIEIYETNGLNWWNIRVDANTGEYLAKDNYVAHCSFEGGIQTGPESQYDYPAIPYRQTAFLPTATGSYRVYPIPIESPNHGARTLISETAAEPLASPEGWHKAGATAYTITRGNNVYAYEDPDNTGYATLNIFGFSPDGGASLLFDYPIDFNQEPVTYREAAITNLFYWNNVVHDVWYQYGFDEPSGNFQTTNYGKGGLETDHVMAEAQDGRNIGNRNNANFATPPDGTRPRMQMYLWSAPSDPEGFAVTAPASLAGFYPYGTASFGPALPPVTPLTGNLVLALDGAGISSEDACEPLTNGAAITGNIALLYRGACNFTAKVKHAQNAGAIAVVVINNVGGGPITMGGSDPSITIPSVMISMSDGALLRAALDGGATVSVALKKELKPEIDGDLDNGIIVHEYGHGISNRLTGGPNVTFCLGNAEQAGEGWSDWFALVMTMQPTDTREKIRGIGTFALAQPTDGLGIRPAPYSTDFTVNNATYGLTNNPSISRPHGIGFVWATALWEMTWDLIDAYGYDPDLYHGNGGNNMAMQLVIDGLKLQPCRPGFIDSRDAILLADRINYGGANQELIWEAFARRGFGFSASQGSNLSSFDQVEAFDLPPAYLCTTPLTIEAIPTSNVYTGGVPTNLYIGYGPQSVTLQASGEPTNTYSWSPAAGLSATNIANPVFTPTAPGSYTFTVQAVNADQCTKYASITIEVIDVRCGKNNDKVLLCHKGKDLCVDAVGAADHLAHGDALAACGSGATVAAASEERSLKASPNPFGSQTNLQFMLPEDGNYRLEIRNGDGNLVGVIAEGKGQAGQHYQLNLDSNSLPNGLYLIRLVTAQEAQVLRVMVSR